MNFAESVEYLYSLGNEVSAMKLGLDNIRTLLGALGDPQNKYLKVQVAGTNGKGSVCAFLDSICLSSGVKTGLYTSPHLISITERIKIAGVDISEAEFARIGSVVRDTAERLLSEGALEYRPTFFEQMTAIALVAFADAEVELAILETGLGGRLDATTAANAEIAAITRIDLDHQEYLGETIEQIAAEKAAIIHEWSNVVIANQRPDAEQVIQERLDHLGINGRRAAEVSTTCGSGWLQFESRQAKYTVKQLGLRGRHQIENAEIAIQVAEMLQKHFSITAEHIAEGLQNARHPGRLEYAGQFLFDGAHNPAGARALGEYLDEFVHRPITMIFAAMKGKDVAEIAAILFPKADKLILTQPGNSRAMTSEELSAFVPADYSREKLVLTEHVAEAIDAARGLAGADGLILITGSLYLVGEAKKILNN